MRKNVTTSAQRFQGTRNGKMKKIMLDVAGNVRLENGTAQPVADVLVNGSSIAGPRWLLDTNKKGHASSESKRQGFGDPVSDLAFAHSPSHSAKVVEMHAGAG